jgi:hypothetical protein
MLAGDDFFRQAKRSISHDKKVLKRLESHPLAHASGWDLSSTGRSAGPSLGGKRWQKQNDKLEKQLEDMSSSVIFLVWACRRACVRACVRAFAKNRRTEEPSRAKAPAHLQTATSQPEALTPITRTLKLGEMGWRADRRGLRLVRAGE